MDKMKLVNDSLNRLDVSAVPIVLFVDQHGVIRKRNPKRNDIGEFLEAEFSLPSNASLVKIPSRPGDDAALNGKFDSAIRLYKKHLAANPTDARTTFRLGVCYRKRFDAATDNGERDVADFSRAVQNWQAALALDPNQYIWRRRLQQYGPVLSKPYPFYDWVQQARSDIKSRGETPVSLSAEPAGAELVGPRQSIPVKSNREDAEPDPQDRVNRDLAGAISIQSAVVKSTERKKAARVHLMLQPSELTGYQWNNEVEPVRIWWDSGQSLLPSKQLIEVTSDGQPEQPTSGELRSTEFEVSWKNAAADRADRKLTGYAVYHLCNKTTGVCVFMRQDISIDVLRGKPSAQ